VGSHAPDATRDAAAVLEAVRRLVRFLRLAEADAQAATGLSAAQLFILRQLADQPASSLAELAERTLTDPSSVSSVVDRLVRRGLVRRHRPRSDARRVELRLTAIGGRVVRTAPATPQESIAHGVSALPEGSRAEVVRSLELLLQSIGADAMLPRMLFEDEPVKPRRSTSRATASA
jgi:DNA-binding MarR family transcriptional regulator